MSAIDELRENLREAARRDVEARHRVRRRHRRTLGLLIALLLGGGAAATAADLIAVGEPVPDLPTASKFRPSEDRQIVSRATVGGIEYGVALYKGNNGQTCVLGGHVRAGTQLGKVEGGKFRPYSPNHAGACGQPDQINLSPMRLDNRWVVAGYVPEWVRNVIVEGKPRARSESGVVLLVFDGTLTRDDLRVDPPAKPR